MSTELISANHAAAMAATLAGRANREGLGFGSGVYPITPQTECIELLCKQDFEKGHVVRVESEHSAMGACIGFSQAGARSFTASSSNGLAYMAENVYAAALYRLPIVMMAVNRTLGPPWNIWVDHGDTLMLRDSGWIQFYCEDNQEVLDTTLLAFRLGEDKRVLLPVLVCQDAFVLSHTMMQTEVHRKQHAQAMERVFAVYDECRAAFESSFGRRPEGPIVPYRMENADLVLVSMGTMASTVRMAVDTARERGVKVGAIRLRMFRPFPELELGRALASCSRVGVLDRNISLGHGGVLWSELRGCAPPQSLVQGYVVGLGGGDVRPDHVLDILADLEARDAAGPAEFFEVG